MKKYAIAALAVVAIGAAIAWAQVISIPPPAGVNLMACVYNLTPVTLTSGQPAYAQCDSTGHLVTGGGGGGAVTQSTIPWQGSIVDATATTTVAVKPASTPALATDPALAIRTCDGCQATFGAEGDAAQTDYTVTASYMSYFKGLLHVAQNPIACLTATAANTNTYTTGLTEPANCDLHGSQWVAQGAAGATAWLTSVQAIATGGSSTTGNIAANNTTGVLLKNSPGTIYGAQLGGIGSIPAYLKLYDASSAPTCGSGTPVKRLIIPAASTAANGAGSNINFGPSGVAFTTGIGYCITTGIADNDTTAPSASTYLVNVDWK